VYDLLTADADSLEQLRDLMAELIEPELWTAADAADPEADDADDDDPAATLTADSAKQALVVAAPERVHFQVLVLCEKLRVARGKSQRSSYPPQLFALPTRREQAAAKLAVPLSLNYGRPALLVDILARIERDSSVRILVDWQAVEEAGWNPDGLATLTADKQPLGEALSSLLLPMDLAWRVVDGETLQVTTPAVLASRPELEVYPLGELLAGQKPEELLERIRAGLGPHHFRTAGGIGELQYDAGGQCLVAALPQPQHDALVALLREWRAAK
jgi:hypothetical protein